MSLDELLNAAEWTDNLLDAQPNWKAIESDPRFTLTRLGVPRPFPAEYEPGRWKGLHCRLYSGQLAERHAELRVVSGYALAPTGAWVAHWWCTDDAGRVVDPSWWNEGLDYVGIDIETWPVG